MHRKFIGAGGGENVSRMRRIAHLVFCCLSSLSSQTHYRPDWDLERELSSQWKWGILNKTAPTEAHTLSRTSGDSFLWLVLSVRNIHSNNERRTRWFLYGLLYSKLLGVSYAFLIFPTVLLIILLHCSQMVCSAWISYFNRRWFFTGCTKCSH